MKIHLDKIPLNLPDNTFVELDVELFGAEKHRLHRPTGKFACLTVCPDGENVYLITDENLTNIILGRVDNCVWSAHNAEFDLQQLRRWADIQPRKKIWCSMIMEKLLWSGYYDRFSLKDLARRYLGVYLEKEARELFSDAHELTEEMIHYAAMDAVIGWKVTQAQKKEVLKRPDVWKVWKEIDSPALWPFLDFSGFRIDKTEWLRMADANKLRAEELKSAFDFLPSSWQQVQKKLRATGFVGLPSTGEKILLSWINRKPDTEAATIAARVLEYRGVAKLASTYGTSWVKYMEQIDDDVYVIYAHHKLTGAETGRTAVSDPPLHNVPMRKNPEFRKPFIAKPGNDLIVADWTAQEPFLQAYFSRDEALLDIIRSKQDIYVTTAKIFGREIEKSDPYRNERIKPTFLGSVYGLTPPGMSDQYDIPVEECEELQEKFWDAFPGSYRWCQAQRQKNDYVETIMGRRFWLNTYERQKEENALNHPHQGSGADILKITLAKLHQGWDWACPFGVVHQNHDEIVMDVPKKYSKDAAHFLQETMESVGTEMVEGLIEFKASAVICQNWLEGK